MISVDAALKLGGFDLDIAFENDDGITALFGRSGSGKSTTINLIAGLARPDRGRIVLDGRTLVDTETGVYRAEISAPRRPRVPGHAALSASQRQAESSVRAVVRTECGADD